MAKTDKVATTQSERKAQMARFTYEGVPIHKITPVTVFKDLRVQITEIEKRLEAMAEYCLENKLVMTPLHMMNCLGVTEHTYTNYLRGTVRDTKSRNGQMRMDADLSPRKSDKEVALIKERSELLKRWEAICNQNCLDTVARDNQFGRSIYLSKAIFHNWDTPQDKGVVETSIEVLLGKANRIRLKQEQAKRTKTKGDASW